MGMAGAGAILSSTTPEFIPKIFDCFGSIISPPPSIPLYGAMGNGNNSNSRGSHNPATAATGGTGSPNNGCGPNDPNCGREYRELKPNQSGKESKNDIPSWAKGQRPYKGENGKQFAERVLNDFYGKNGWSGTGSNSEFSQLKKFADSGFLK